MSDYHAEFPDFESEIPAVFLAAPWTDASWHNDATPSFSRPFGGDRREIHVFVDEADPAKRWDAPDCPRFSVHTTDADGSFDGDGPCFFSDSLTAVLDHVGFLAGEVSR
jgi:hypothetical protein